jgi:hypothetical protein
MVGADHRSRHLMMALPPMNTLPLAFPAGPQRNGERDPAGGRTGKQGGFARIQSQHRID